MRAYTGALFVFWEQHPRSAISRKFTREGAAVSSCGVKESDHPPPFRMVKRESRPAHWDFSTAKRESTERRPSGGVHGGGPGGAKKGFFYTRKAGLPVLRVSQTTQKLRRLLSCFFARKER